MAFEPAVSKHSQTNKSVLHGTTGWAEPNSHHIPSAEAISSIAKVMARPPLRVERQVNSRCAISDGRRATIAEKTGSSRVRYLTQGFQLGT